MNDKPATPEDKDPKKGTYPNKNEENNMGKVGIVGLGLYNFLLLALSVWLMIFFWPQKYEFVNTSEKLKVVTSSITDLSKTFAETESTLKNLTSDTEKRSRLTTMISEEDFGKKRRFLTYSIDVLNSMASTRDSLRSKLANMNNGYAPKSLGNNREVSAEVCFFLIVILAGILGSLIHSIYHYVYRVGYKYLERSWLSWHLFRPVWGAALALVFYFIVRGDVVVSATKGFESTSPYGLAAVAAIVGFASRQAISKLNAVFKLLFQKTDLEAAPGSPKDTGQGNGGNNPVNPEETNQPAPSQPPLKPSNSESGVPEKDPDASKDKG